MSFSYLKALNILIIWYEILSRYISRNCFACFLVMWPPRTRSLLGSSWAQCTSIFVFQHNSWTCAQPAVLFGDGGRRHSPSVREKSLYCIICHYRSSSLTLWCHRDVIRSFLTWMESLCFFSLLISVCGCLRSVSKIKWIMESIEICLFVSFGLHHVNYIRLS